MLNSQDEAAMRRVRELLALAAQHATRYELACSIAAQAANVLAGVVHRSSKIIALERSKKWKRA
jgi:hypothetical protein